MYVIFAVIKVYTSVLVSLAKPIFFIFEAESHCVALACLELAV